MPAQGLGTAVSIQHSCDNACLSSGLHTVPQCLPGDESERHWDWEGTQAVGERDCGLLCFRTAWVNRETAGLLLSGPPVSVSLHKQDKKGLRSWTNRSCCYTFLKHSAECKSMISWQCYVFFVSRNALGRVWWILWASDWDPSSSKLSIIIY